MLSTELFRRALLVFLLAAACLAAGSAKASSGRAELYQQLCELNQGWQQRTPDYSALPTGWNTQGETALIQTHLQLVIDQLEQAGVAHLTAEQVARRGEHIETLRSYMQRGEFPRNLFVPGRRPVFIDPWGTHCAVGYLIAASGNAELARRINAEHQLDYLADIRTEGLAEWQAASGLSLAELALIQPSYHYFELNYPKEIEDLILGNSAAARKAIKEEPALVDARCGGKTLLHFAAAAGDLEFCKFLVEQGADINAVSSQALDAKKPANEKPQPPRVGVSSSSTIYNVRWNEPTQIIRNGGGGGLRMGRGGRVFRTNIGWAISGVLDDMRGGLEGKSALYYATQGMRITPVRPFGEPNREIEKLIADRAAVAAWLTEQGAK